MFNFSLGNSSGQTAADISTIKDLRKKFIDGVLKKKERKRLEQAVANISSSVNSKCGLQDGFIPVNFSTGKPRFDLLKKLMNERLLKGNSKLPNEIGGVTVVYKKFEAIFSDKIEEEVEYAGLDGKHAPGGICESSGLDISPTAMSEPIYTVMRFYYPSKIAPTLKGMKIDVDPKKANLQKALNGEKVTEKLKLKFLLENFGQEAATMYKKVKMGRINPVSRIWNIDSNSSFSTAGNPQGNDASGLSGLNDGEPDYSYIQDVHQLKNAVINSNKVDDIAGLLGYALENLQKFGLSNNTERGFRSIMANIGGDFGKNHRIGFHKDEIRKAFTWG